MVKWFAASDHAGYQLKQDLVACLRELGDEVVDLGTSNGNESVDYPDLAEAVARRVAADGDTLGLLVCGTGIGVAVTANKIPGVRAAVATGAFMARMARAHNNANVVALGQRVIGPGVAEDVVRVFRDTPFEGGRHERRLRKIEALERTIHGGGVPGAPDRS
jgi:ribose 5-phosphate isomerase B